MDLRSEDRIIELCPMMNRSSSSCAFYTDASSDLTRRRQQRRQQRHHSRRRPLRLEAITVVAVCWIATATRLLQEVIQPSHGFHQRGAFRSSSSRGITFGRYYDDARHHNNHLRRLPPFSFFEQQGDTDSTFHSHHHFTTRSRIRGESASATSTALPCQLLGMNCANPTEFALSWPSFCERGGKTDIHADGWGLAYYQGHGLRSFHDVEPASTSALAQFLGQQPIQTSNMLSHIRYATSGEVDLANVHPFSREMWGIQWCFCHNGQVPLFDDHPHAVLGLEKETHHEKEEGDGPNGADGVNGDATSSSSSPDDERVYFPIGDTDSEAAFCAILNALRAQFTVTMPSLPTLYEALQRLCAEIVNYNPQETILNFMLTCGPHVLWVYSWPGKRPGSTVWNGLHYTVRGSSTNLSDVDYSINVSVPQNSTTTSTCPDGTQNCPDQDKVKNDDKKHVCIVATSPLTDDEEWIELKQGELILLDEGIPRVSVADLFRVELQGHGLNDNRRAALSPPRLEEDMRRYEFQPDFFAASGI